jgi:hypothetical protein
MTDDTPLVTQVDRENAWPFIPSNSIAGTDREGFLAGAYDDTPTVRMITSIRLAASQSSAERIASLEVGLRAIANYRQHSGLDDGENAIWMERQAHQLLNKGSEPCPK